MTSLTIQKTWNVNGIPTNVTSISLAIVQNNSGATVVAAGTAMDQVATGVYEFTLSPANGGTTYTATITIVYNGQTYTETVVGIPEITIEWPNGFQTILNQLMTLAAQITLSPNPTYSVHGHLYRKGEYLDILGRQIEQFMKLNAQAHPFEIVSRGN
ncbi:MAG: hypothetical protein ACLP9L_34695 [Thermoguttaceae bacterium]